MSRSKYRPGRRRVIEELEKRVLFSVDPSAALVVDAAWEDGRDPAELRELEAAEASLRHEHQVRSEVVFVDGSAPDAARLVSELRAQTDAKRHLEVVELSAEHDGIAEITAFLAERDDLDAVHVISHGTSAGVQLGSSWLTAQTLEARAVEVASWGDAMTLEGDLLFYGCDLAAGSAGRAWVDAVGSLTGAEVAASDDLTGASRVGGDWDLEYATGAVEAQLAPGASARASMTGTLSATPATGELLLNTTTQHQQREPAAAIASDGTWVAVWESDRQDGSGGGIYGQRFDADGNAIGGEFQVHSQTSGDQRNAEIAMADDGSFVVVWESTAGDTSIRGQRFAADATRVGGEFVVAEGDEDDESAREPDVAMNGSGAFVVSWARETDSGGERVYARAYDAAGAAVSGAVRVDQGSGASGVDTKVGIDASGRFAVTWTGEGQDGSGEAVLARRFDAGATALGDSFVVNQSVDGDQDRSSIAMNASGEFVIAWTTVHSGSGEGEDVFARRYDASGIAVGDEFQVNDHTSDDQDDPDVAIDASGNFAIVWESEDQDGSNEGVFARLYRADGAQSGPVFQVNETTPEVQDDPVVAWNGSGRMVVAWDDRGAGDDDGTFARIYAVDYDDNQAPSIADQDFSVDENAAAGTVVGTVVASDPDDGDVLGYAIAGGNPGGAFAIDAATGTLRVANPAALDFETTPAYSLTVEVEDSGGLTRSATVTVDLNDLNESPSIADQGFVVDENAAAGTVVGTVVASDPDDGDVLGYAIAGGDPGGAFAIDAATGTLRVANPAALDFETTPSYSLTVEVTDAGGLARSATVTVDLNDLNEASSLVVPGVQTVGADQSLVFTSSTGNAIRVVDPDAVTQFEVTLVAEGGALTLGDTSGVAFVQGDGVADEVVVFRGTLDTVNTALEGMTFTPHASYAGPASIEMTAEDLASEATAPATGSLAIQVEPAAADAAVQEDEEEEADSSEEATTAPEEATDGGAAEADLPTMPGTPGAVPGPVGSDLPRGEAMPHGTSPPSPFEPGSGPLEAAEAAPRALYVASEDGASGGRPVKDHATILREDQALADELSELARDLRSDDESVGEQRRMTIAAFERVGIALSAGIVAAAARGSSLVAMLLSALPMWRKVDPLVLLGLTREERRQREEELRRAADDEAREIGQASEMLDQHPGREDETPD